LFIPRERAALAWTEVLTKLPEQGVPDDIYDRVRGQLSEKEVSDLTFVIMAINAWNRINIGFKTVPGSFDAKFGLEKAGLSTPPLVSPHEVKGKRALATAAMVAYKGPPGPSPDP
jgi:hypothetical protein